MTILRPLILIHDLGGCPQDWDRWGLEAFLIREGGLDHRLIRRFDFGFRREGTVPQYDAQGDLIQIAHRLSDDSLVPGGEAFQVDRLAAESLALGGPGKVSIVALGAGGLIARYYLSRAEPDKLDTQYNGRVDKLILVATPNQGALLGPATVKPLLGRWWKRPLHTANSRAALQVAATGLGKLRDRVLAEMPAHGGPSISPKALGVLQSKPNSFLLRWLNRPERAPKDVRLYCLAGDTLLSFPVRYRTGNRALTLHFGDLLVMVGSATRIPGARPEIYLFDRTHHLDLTAPEEAINSIDWFGGDLPPIAHTRLMHSRELQQTVLNILAAD